MHALRPCFGILLLASLAAACGGDAEPAEVADNGQAAAAQPAPPPPAAPTSADRAPLAAEDVDRWQRGMEAELRALEEAATRLRGARTAQDSSEAYSALTEDATRTAGAAAAGVSPDRYRFITATLSRAAAFLAPERTPGMPAEMEAQAQQGRETALAGMGAELPPAAMDALRPRAAELRQLDLRLAGERIRVMEGGA